MKDLYYRLGIEPQSSEEEIAAALDTKPELSACAGILLDPERRAQYDETHHTLKTIGLLRHRLGLDTGHSWFLENCADFAPRKSLPFAGKQPGQPAAGAHAHENRQSPPSPVAPPAKPALRSSKALPVALGLIGLVVAILLIAWLMS